MSSEYLLDIDGFSDSSIKGNDVERYKGKKGVTDRVGFVYSRTAVSDIPKSKLQSVSEQLKSGTAEKRTIAGVDYILQPKPFAAKVHFSEAHKQLGYFFCLSTPGTKSLCCEKLGQPSLRLVSKICHYHTDKNGKPSSPLGYTLKLWVYTENKYLALKTKNDEFPLVVHDLLLNTSEETYQKMDVTPCKDALWRLKPDLEDQIYEESLTLDKAAEQALGRERSLDEIKEAFGISTSEIPETGSDDLSSLLDQFGSLS